MSTRWVSLILLLSTLVGCSAPVAKDGAALKPTQGLLAFKFTSTDDAKVTFMAFSPKSPSPESSIGSHVAEDTFGPKGFIKVSAGEKYYVIPMEVGEYMWSRVDVGRRFAAFQATNRFRVHTDAITYVGSFRLIFVDNKVTLSVLDRGEDMRKYLQDSYPSYWKSMSFDKDVAQFRCCQGQSR